MTGAAEGVATVRARLGLPGEVAVTYTTDPVPMLRIGNGPRRTLPLQRLPQVDDAIICELIASSHPEDLLQPGDLAELGKTIPSALRNRWFERADAVAETARQILNWTVAPLTEPGLLARVATAADRDPLSAAERYASQVGSPIRALTADLPDLVRRLHEPVPGAVGALVRAQLGDTLAALVPATVLVGDDSAPRGWTAVHAGGCLLGWGRSDDPGPALVTLIRANAWRLITVRQISAALTSFAQRTDSAHIEWFARQLYTDEEITRAIRTLLRAGRPATALPVLLRELSSAVADSVRCDERIASAVARIR